MAVLKGYDSVDVAVVVQSTSRVWLGNPMYCSMPVSPLFHCLPKCAQTHVHWVSDAIYLILCHPLLLLPSIFLRVRVVSNESVLRIRWLKYWSFSFSIGPSNEHSGLISFRMGWLDLLAVQGTLSTTILKPQFFGSQPSLWCHFHNH